jgi:hypothetical protein
MQRPEPVTTHRTSKSTGRSFSGRDADIVI